MKTVICALGVIFFATAASAAGPFDGKWTAHVERPAPNQPQEITIALTTTDGKVSGSFVVNNAPEIAIEWGFVAGDLITLKVKGPTPEGMLPFYYVGRVEGDTLTFGRRPENLSIGFLVQFAAKRAK